MASSKIPPRTTLEHILECKLCKDTLKEPHTLRKCHHSYCKSCIVTIPKKEKDCRTGWYCPTCSKFNEEDDVQENHFIDDLQKLLKANLDKPDKISCKQCLSKGKKAEWMCNDCRIELCPDCKLIHLNIPVLKNHHTRLIQKGQCAKTIDKMLFCKLHRNKIIELNCKSCETPVCSLCIPSHGNDKGHSLIHQFESIDQALERLLPEMNKKIVYIEKDITQIESDVAVLSNMINETKDAYSLCRIELDERLAKLIDSLKETKAEMEDRMAKEETNALNILGSLKQNLDHRISFAKNLINVVTITKDYARNISLLDEVQNGLRENVDEYTKYYQEIINYRVTTPTFADGYSWHKDTLEQLFGELCYSTNYYAANAGALWTEKFQYDNFMDLNSEIKPYITLHIGNWCNRLTIEDNNKITVCLKDIGDIKTHYFGYKGWQTMANKKGITVVKKAMSGDVIGAGTTGLFVTSDDFTKWTKIADGGYSDVYVHGMKFTALQYKPSSCAVTYSLIKYLDHCEWELVSVIRPKHEFQSLDCSSTLLMHNDGNLVIAVQKKLYKISSEGTIISQYESDKWTPSLCGVDKRGHLLISSYEDGKIYIISDPADLAISQGKVIETGAKQLRDVIVINPNFIFMLQGPDHKLVKYS